MTDLLLLMIVGKLFEVGNWYWVLIGIISAMELAKAICDFFKVIKRDVNNGKRKENR